MPLVLGFRRLGKGWLVLQHRAVSVCQYNVERPEVPIHRHVLGGRTQSEVFGHRTVLVGIQSAKCGSQIPLNTGGCQYRRYSAALK